LKLEHAINDRQSGGQQQHEALLYCTTATAPLRYQHGIDSLICIFRPYSTAQDPAAPQHASIPIYIYITSTSTYPFHDKYYIPPCSLIHFALPQKSTSQHCPSTSPGISPLGAVERITAGPLPEFPIRATSHHQPAARARQTRNLTLLSEITSAASHQTDFAAADFLSNIHFPHCPLGHHPNLLILQSKIKSSFEFGRQPPNWHIHAPHQSALILSRRPLRLSRRAPCPKNTPIPQRRDIILEGRVARSTMPC
jgi:hypothetical protein